ncbi:G-protein alpha subunit [Mycena venus]|uniref:G-protein alpha subunit n=1 Tax=Mycena venus TaxID=2733690 RepID=A0A8H6YH02_9AGAR|nr:G-protein alpha subunit [Mycena venus]
MPDRRAHKTNNSYFNPFNISLQPPANETQEEKAARLKAQEATSVAAVRFKFTGGSEPDRGNTRGDTNFADNRCGVGGIEENAGEEKALDQDPALRPIGIGEEFNATELAFTPKYFESERLVWKTVIQINLISSIKKILTVLQEEWEALETDSAESKYDTPLTSEHKRLELSFSPLLAFETSISQNKLHKLRRSPSATPESQPSTDDIPSQVTQVLATCKNKIIALWDDGVIRGILRSHSVYLQDDSGFFLDDTPRITALDYIPSDRDIMRARIRTLGVEEHRFVTESGTRNHISTMYKPSSFLAPLIFWQRLDEDSKVNPLQDSLELWRELVGNPLLAKIALILVFNKKDVLQAHIAAGMMVKKYLPNFGDRPNDVASVTRYFRDKFSACLRKFSPEPRPFIFYETGAINIKLPAVILKEVQNQISLKFLKDLDGKETPVLFPEAAEADPPSTNDLSQFLRSLGVDLRSLGRHEDALQVDGEPADLCRKLAEVDPTSVGT